jgi:hypothetical protein
MIQKWSLVHVIYSLYTLFCVSIKGTKNKLQKAHSKATLARVCEANKSHVEFMQHLIL